MYNGIINVTQCNSAKNFLVKDRRMREKKWKKEGIYYIRMKKNEGIYYKGFLRIAFSTNWIIYAANSIVLLSLFHIPYLNNVNAYIWENFIYLKRYFWKINTNWKCAFELLDCLRFSWFAQMKRKSFNIKFFFSDKLILKMKKK